MAKKIQQSEVNRHLEKSENAAYGFVKTEDRYNKRSDRKDELTDKVGGLEPLWIALSIVVLLASVGMVFIEGNMGKNAFATILDPLGLSTNQTIAILGGALLGITALFSGAELHPAIIGIKHPITGRRSRKIDGHFYLGMLLMAIVVTFQYFLVQAAGDGGSEFISFKIIAITFPIIETIFGLLFLDRAMTYVFVLFMVVLMWFGLRKMTRLSKGTNETYRDYNMLRITWNSQNPTVPPMILEGNPNIRKAIAFFSGLNLNEPTVSNDDNDNNTNDNVNTSNAGNKEITDDLDELTDENSFEDDITL